MKILLWFTINIIIITNVFAQQKCGTMEALNYFLENNASQIESFNEAKNFIKNNNKERINPGEVFTIPCVVHVVWRTPSENISDNVIYDGIAVLNEDFRKLNDLENIKSEFKSTAADSEIEFCLANIDPNGNPTTGINRVKTSVSDLGEDYFENKIKFDEKGGYNAWPSDQYLNIWVGNISNDGLLGYAQFPRGGSKETDGIVLDDTSFGRSIGNEDVSDDGTASHEVGHWLGLRHIWGDDEDCDNINSVGDCMCDGTDGINDTNNAAGPARGCKKDAITCGSTDMIQNFMDYSSCSLFFTAGQVKAMRRHLASGGFRDGLPNSKKCANLIPNDVAITEIDFPKFDETICTTNFTPTITIANNGTDTLKQAIFKIKLSGEDAINYIWEGALNFAEFETIKLEEMNTTTGSKDIEISVVSINGVADENDGNNKLKNNFLVELQNAATLPLNEDFEENWPNNNWINNNFNNDVEFVKTDEVTHFGKNCLILENYNNDAVGKIDEIISKNLIPGSFTNPKLRFFYAYTGINEESNDEFMVLISQDCGVHFDTLFHAKGSELATSSTKSDYFSPIASDWDRVVIDLAEYQNSMFANFYFRFTSGLGNNFYIDDISIFGKEEIVDVIDLESTGLSIYPNPFQSHFTIDLPLNGIKTSSNLITIFNASGKIVYSKEHSTKNKKIIINTIQTSGIYYLHIFADDKQFIKKIIKL